MGEESQRYHSGLQGTDPNTLKGTHFWAGVLEDIAHYAPSGAERWSFGRSSGENGYYFVRYYTHN